MQMFGGGYSPGGGTMGTYNLRLFEPKGLNNLPMSHDDIAGDGAGETA